MSLIIRQQRSPTADEIDAWLLALWLATKHEKKDEQTMSATLDIYARQLRDFPADIVATVLLDWPKHPRPRDAHHWFPAAGELADACRALAQPREELRHALATWTPVRDAAKHKAHLQWSLERIRSGRPFVEHRKEYARDRKGLIARLEAELEAMEG